jgi:hypothetical protein
MNMAYRVINFIFLVIVTCCIEAMLLSESDSIALTFSALATQCQVKGDLECAKTNYMVKITTF